MTLEERFRPAGRAIFGQVRGGEALQRAHQRRGIAGPSQRVTVGPPLLCP
jgi:hypothetical protein